MNKQADFQEIDLPDTQNTVKETIEKIRATLKGIRETSNAYEKFKDDFRKTLAQFGEKIETTVSEQNTEPSKGDKLDLVPSNVDEVIKEMMNKSHIVVLTGAGLSAASNLPTFRGDGGYWTLRNKQETIKATDFLTHEYFNDNPSEIWCWHHEFKKISVKNAPNVSHDALAELQLFCKGSSTKLTLITQNIDGYHVDAYVNAIQKSQKPKSKDIKNAKCVEVKKNTDNKSIPKKPFEEKKLPEPNFSSPNFMTKYGICDDIYEIHGSIKYMRCDNNCTFDLYPGPEADCPDDFVPKCPKCQGIARPHTLLFDESYQEEYYRGTTVMTEIESMDCLIVIGTALETNLALRIVKKAVKDNILIVEINPHPIIRSQNIRHLIGGAEKFIPSISEGLQKKMLERKKNTIEKKN